MVASTLLVSSLLTGSAIAAAVPAGNTIKNGRAEIQQVRGFKKAFSGARANYKAHLKYGAEVPQYLKEAVAYAKANALAKRVSGSATTTPEAADEAYLTPVSIGTPAQVLNLDFDTGSSDLWVFSSSTPASERSGHAYYTPSSSSTAKTLSGYTWSISYGDGSSSSGNVVDDVVTIGGVSFASQAVEIATSVSDEFTEDTANDGLVGLAFDTLNTVKPTKQKTFLSNVLSSLDTPVLTADLKHAAPGTYGLGFIDSSKYTGSITYTPVTQAQYWQFSSTGYAVGSGAFSSTSISGIADTGTTLIYVPSSIVSAYYKGVPGAANNNQAGGWVYSCSATLPSFTYGVGSARITVPGSYIGAFGSAGVGGNLCFGGIQSSSSIGINIFGDLALKAAYVVFDEGNKRLGFASKTLN